MLFRASFAKPSNMGSGAHLKTEIIQTKGTKLTTKDAKDFLERYTNTTHVTNTAAKGNPSKRPPTFPKVPDKYRAPQTSANMAMRAALKRNGGFVFMAYSESVSIHSSETL
jgi:hypothetical protein